LRFYILGIPKTSSFLPLLSSICIHIFSKQHPVYCFPILRQAFSLLFMFKPPPPNPLKRQRPEQHLPTPPSSKRQKPEHYPEPEPFPPTFWDSLSKVWLTKNAIKEFDQRNAEPPLKSHEFHRPITRNFQAQLKKKDTAQRLSATDFLAQFEPKHWKELKRLARRGGPDILDLVAVGL